MIKYIRNILTITLTIVILFLCACNASDLTRAEDAQVIEKAIEELLSTENYSSGWDYNAEFITNGNLLKTEVLVDSKIFHYPYKLKSKFIKFDEGPKGIVAISEYQFQKKGEIIYRGKYQFEDGSVKLYGKDVKEVLSYELFVEQVKNNLISEKYIGEDILSEAKTNKYEIKIKPYAFYMFLGLQFNKNEELTKIIEEEFVEFTGFAYIDIETNEICKLEFKIPNQTEICQVINERIQNEMEDSEYLMPDIQKLYFSMSFSDVNDESAECAEIEKEIDEVMKLEVK